MVKSLRFLNLPKSTVWYLINDPEWLSGKEEREENEERRFGEFEEMIKEIIEREKSRSSTDVNRLLLEAILEREREREEERRKRLLIEMLKLWAI